MLKVETIFYFSSNVKLFSIPLLEPTSTKQLGYNIVLLVNSITIKTATICKMLQNSINSNNTLYDASIYMIYIYIIHKIRNPFADTCMHAINVTTYSKTKHQYINGKCMSFLRKQIKLKLSMNSGAVYTFLDREKLYGCHLIKRAKPLKKRRGLFRAFKKIPSDEKVLQKCPRNT